MSIREYSKLQFKSVSSSKTTRDDSDRRNRQWYYRCANFEKSRTALHHHVSLIPSAYRLSKSSSSPKSGPLQYFHPLVKEDSAGWMQRCTQYFANFSPRLTCLIHSFFQERFGVDVYGRKPCAHRVSISIGWNGPLPTPSSSSFSSFSCCCSSNFRHVDDGTNGKRRKFVAGSLISPVDALM